MPKEVYILSGPSELQPVADYITQYTHREKDLPQLPSTLEAQDTHRESATAVSQALIASSKLWVDQRRMVTIPRVYRRTRSMLKIRCTDIQKTRHNYSQSTESQKAKFQTPSTSNEARNYVEHNSVEKISDDLVHQTKSDTASASIFSESEEREEIAADVPTPADILHLHLHLHPHWRQSRNSPTLQDQESQQERTLEGQPAHLVTFTCKWS